MYVFHVRYKNWAKPDGADDKRELAVHTHGQLPTHSQGRLPGTGLERYKYDWTRQHRVWGINFSYPPFLHLTLIFVLSIMPSIL